MKTLKITCIIILLSLAGYAQTKGRILVADETELVQLKSSFKIETSNEKIFSLLMKDLKSIVTKYTVSIKKDRSGLYNHYSVPFKQSDYEKVRLFLGKLD